MKKYQLKPNFILQQVGDKAIAVAVDAKDFSGLIRLNKSGEFVFRLLQSEAVSLDDIVAAMKEKYEGDESLMRSNAESIIAELEEKGLLKVTE